MASVTENFTARMTGEQSVVGHNGGFGLRSPELLHGLYGERRSVLVFGMWWAFIVLSPTVFAADNKLTADVVLQHIDKVGPRQAIKDFYDDNRWPQVLHGIGLASAKWLMVYSRLKPGSDGESSETLDDALYDLALPRYPFRVMPIIARDQPLLSWESMCTFTFESQCPPGGISAYLYRIELALRKAKTPWERTVRDSCLRGIQATKTAIPDPAAYCSGDAGPSPADAR